MEIMKNNSDPRFKIIVYLLWYSVLWLNNIHFLGLLLFTQIVIFILLDGHHSKFNKVLWLFIMIGALLSIIAVLFTDQKIGILIKIWCKWGVVILATLNLVIDTTSRELFFVLRFFRIPWAIIFALGIAIRFLPICIEELKRGIIAYKSRGIEFLTDMKSFWSFPKKVMNLLIPILINLLERGQRIWFSIELRGISDRLYTIRSGEYLIFTNLIIIILGLIPIIFLSLELFVSLR
jgi:energy-coupling factor transporter transmembrane protein EcfT